MITYNISRKCSLDNIWVRVLMDSGECDGWVCEELYEGGYHHQRQRSRSQQTALLQVLHRQHCDCTNCRLKYPSRSSFYTRQGHWRWWSSASGVWQLLRPVLDWGASGTRHSMSVSSETSSCRSLTVRGAPRWTHFTSTRDQRRQHMRIAGSSAAT